MIKDIADNVPPGTKICNNTKSSWNTLPGKASTFSSRTSFTHIPELQKIMKIYTKLHILPIGVNCPCDLILGLDVLREVDMILNCKEDTITSNLHQP